MRRTPRITNTGDYVAADTGIYKISVSGGARHLGNQRHLPASATRLYMTLDTADNLVFFDDSIVAATVGSFPP